MKAGGEVVLLRRKQRKDHIHNTTHFWQTNIRTHHRCSIILLCFTSHMDEYLSGILFAITRQRYQLYPMTNDASWHIFHEKKKNKCMTLNSLAAVSFLSFWFLSTFHRSTDITNYKDKEQHLIITILFPGRCLRVSTLQRVSKLPSASISVSFLLLLYPSFWSLLSTSVNREAVFIPALITDIWEVSFLSLSSFTWQLSCQICHFLSPPLSLLFPMDERGEEWQCKHAMWRCLVMLCKSWVGEREPSPSITIISEKKKIYKDVWLSVKKLTLTRWRET